jgi:hypothetical protein
MGVVRALDEGVKDNRHFIELEGVFNHDLTQIVDTVFKEEEFSLLWVHVKELVGNQTKSLDHEGEDVGTYLGALSIA